MVGGRQREKSPLALHTNATIYMYIVDMLSELTRREKRSGIKPDQDLDIFMKV